MDSFFETCQVFVYRVDPGQEDSLVAFDYCPKGGCFIHKFRANRADTRQLFAKHRLEAADLPIGKEYATQECEESDGYADYFSVGHLLHTPQIAPHASTMVS
ncbi:MAG TPA: hypothetical protein VHY84_10930 [Bryobacteraceae bacterium]|nr:hypothetical protein [Bryobacteraceae bacterium]